MRVDPQAAGLHTPSSARPLVLHCVPALVQGGAERWLVDLTRFDTDHDHLIVTLAGRSIFQMNGEPVQHVSLGLAEMSGVWRPGQASYPRSVSLVPTFPSWGVSARHLQPAAPIVQVAGCRIRKFVSAGH